MSEKNHECFLIEVDGNQVVVRGYPHMSEQTKNALAEAVRAVLRDQPKTFTVEWKEHRVGDPRCVDGWCGGIDGYPKPCRCGGLMHADFGDDTEDGYWLHLKCDKCGENYREE